MASFPFQFIECSLLNMRRSGVYAIVNQDNDRIYIGYTHKFGQRRANHYNNLKRNAHPCISLQADYNAGHLLDFRIVELSTIKTAEAVWINRLLAGGVSLYNAMPVVSGGILAPDDPRIVTLALTSSARELLPWIEQARAQCINERALVDLDQLIAALWSAANKEQ